MQNISPEMRAAVTELVSDPDIELFEIDLRHLGGIRYGINNSGNVSRTTDLAGLGGGGVYGNDIGCIVAYAPDCYPQWVNNNTMQRSVLPRSEQSGLIL